MREVSHEREAVLERFQFLLVSLENDLVLAVRQVRRIVVPRPDVDVRIHKVES